MKEAIENAYDILNLDNDIILTYCELYNSLKEEGNLIPDADLLIAATAITKKAKLISKDKDFERLKKFGLKLSESLK